MKFVVHEGKNRALKCNCNSNWKKEEERTRKEDINILVFQNRVACPKCNLWFWITVKGRFLRVGVVK